MSAVFLSNIPVNMQLRNKRYHYRRRVPANLVELFNRKEITKSLHTTEGRAASRLKNKLDGELEALFQACRFNALSQDEAQQRLSLILTGKPLPDLQEATETKITTVKTRNKRAGKRLSEAVDAYCKEKEHSWTQKTKKEYSGIYDRIIKGLGDPWLNDLERTDLVIYRDTLTREGKSIKTVNKYLEILSTVLKHASRLKWIQGNPGEGLGLKDNRRPDEMRRAFTVKEIKTIFEALQRDKKFFYEQGRHERYWLPLLGIYTGGRVNELAQLGIKDIIIEDGIPTIEITENGDDSKSVKTSNSRRKIPIHKDLLTLGFLVYVNNIKAQGNNMLFPALINGPNGYSHYFVKHFSGKAGWLRKQLKDLEKGVAFHSFRHIFIDILKNAEISERLIEEIAGHRLTSMSLGRYGKPYKVDVRLKAINKIDYGLIPKVKPEVRLVDIEGTDAVEEHDYLVCGKTSVRIILEDKEQPLELKQYKRPDLHGYSPFHKEIEGFVEDELVAKDSLDE